MTEEELVKLVDEAVLKTGAKGIGDMGKVIGQVMSKAKGRVDGKKVAEMVKSKLL